MRIPTSILAVLAAALLASSARPLLRAATADKDKTADSVKKVKELRKERIAVLKKLTEQLTELYKNARTPYFEVLEARRQLAEAELDAAETDKDRVEVYKSLVAVLKAHESWADDKRKAGRGTEADVLKARARRLEAEIHLEQARTKVAKESK